MRIEEDRQETDYLPSKEVPSFEFEEYSVLTV